MCRPNKRYTGKEITVDAVPERWISVEDRKPDKLGNYFVYTCTHGYKSMCVMGYDGRWFTDEYEVVTHWRLLPNPPDAKIENVDEERESVR